MMKQREATEPDSCWNKTPDDELVFVLCNRDPAAEVAITAWCQERIRLGLNKEGDRKIEEARAIVREMISRQGFYRKT